MFEIKRVGGIIEYVMTGGKMPSIDFVREFQFKIKEFCENANSIRNDNVTFLDRRERPAIAFSQLYQNINPN